jgi:hypothetical protein
VQGEDRWRTPDWGLDNTNDRDAAREEACLRVQAHLADEVGLRALLIPTTEWRTYYVALGADPSAGDDEPARLSRAALALATRPDVRGPLLDALTATAAFARVGGAWAPAALHPVGFPLGPAGQTCSSCAWIYEGGRGKAVSRCRQTAGDVGDGRRVLPEHPACARWEAPVDCATCGACCREAYDTVNVSMRDPVAWKQPALIVRSGHRFSMLRVGRRCAALASTGDGAAARYTCEIYEDRPRTCRDFERGGRHCLVARRRVGLSA